MPLVMLRRSRPGPFRRNIRDKSGTILKTYVFPVGEPQDVSWDNLDAMRDDMFNALVPVSLSDTGKPVEISREDYEAAIREPTEAELEAATAPDVSELPLSPQMALAIGETQEVSSGAKPARRSR